MVSPIQAKFDTWLSEKLMILNPDVDLDVFVSYISGILEADTPEDEKSESLFGILGELVQSSVIEDECQEIIKKWNEFLSTDDEISPKKELVDIDVRIHSIIEQQNAQASRIKTVTKESLERKAVILAQYAEISDGEDLEDVPGNGKPAACSGTATAAATTTSASTTVPSNEDLLVKNMNALLVKERERNERDRAKQEAELKRQKDKDDRDRQKQKIQGRKEAEKRRTQKGDKKR